MTKLTSAYQIKETHWGQELDYDVYTFLESGLSTKEYTVVVDFLEGSITGDVVAYGGWYDIAPLECVELLEKALNDKKPIRDYTSLIEKVKSNPK